MKRKVGLFIFIVILGTLVACSKDNEVITEVAPAEPLEVELTVTESAEINETVNMEALVTQGEEDVDDADEVVFEIWEEERQDESEKIDSVNEKKGIYTAETAFDKDGTFYIQAHVTARGLHTMPKTTVIIGDGGEYGASEESHFETEGFSMHFMEVDGVKVGAEEKLIVHLELEEEPFKDADVRYELWSEDDPDNHVWVDAEELIAGEYTASYTFLEAKKYTVVVQVEDDNELHERQEYKINVGE